MKEMEFIINYFQSGINEKSIKEKILSLKKFLKEFFSIVFKMEKSELFMKVF